MSLPILFIVLSSATLLGALAALFASLRAALGGTATEPAAAGPGLPDRAALEDEKNALLRALKDLEYEHEVGKIGDADYERLDHAYRIRAKQVLAELDRDLGPYVSQAEALINRTLGGEASEPRAAKKATKKKAKAKVEEVEAQPSDEAADEAPAEAKAEAEPEAKAELEAEAETKTEDATRVCAKCGTKNDADARFCKQCASPLADAAEVSS